MNIEDINKLAEYPQLKARLAKLEAALISRGLVCAEHGRGHAGILTKDACPLCALDSVPSRGTP